MSFNDFPAELRARPNWVNWRYVRRDDGKLTKLPYQAATGQLASVTDPNHWSTFDAAARACQTAGVGVGYVLTPDDGYVFIDLDDVSDLPNATEMREWHRQIEAAFDSYSEISPSGNGLHILTKGVLGTGRNSRTNKVEMYGQGRYLTVTGNTYRNTNAKPQQALIDKLYAEIGGSTQIDTGAVRYVAEKEPDETVLANAYGAANGVKFQALFEGRFQDAGFASQSEADYALIDMLQWFTPSRQQIKRLFMSSGLGKREKAERPGYVDHMIDKSFDRAPQNIDIDSALAAVEASRNRTAAEKAIAAHAEPVSSDPAADPVISPLPGLMGEIAYFIYQQAPRPVPHIAIAGAFGLMAGICGRAFNVSSTGLNLYILMLAETGRGKEAIASGIQKLMAAVYTDGGMPGAKEFIGPQEISSGQALIRHLSRTSKSFVSLISEFDHFMGQVIEKHPPLATQKLQQVMLYGYARSGAHQQLDGTIFADSEKNVEPIQRPAFSIIGEGTPRKFYELLSEDIIGNGFLPRFSIIEFDGPRPPANPNAHNAVPKPPLVQSLARLCQHALALNQKGAICDVAMTADAAGMFSHFNDECDTRINTDEQRSLVELWNRAHLKALRMAALIAVGCNWLAPVIDATAAAWAINVCRHDVMRLTSKFAAGDVGEVSSFDKMELDVKRKLAALFSGAANPAKYGLNAQAVNMGMFNYRYLLAAVSSMSSFKSDKRGSANALNDLLRAMQSAGVIAEVSRMQKDMLQLTGQCYVMHDIAWANSR